MGFNARRQLSQSVHVEFTTGLIGVGFDVCDGDVLDGIHAFT